MTQQTSFRQLSEAFLASLPAQDRPAAKARLDEAARREDYKNGIIAIADREGMDEARRYLRMTAQPTRLALL